MTRKPAPTALPVRLCRTLARYRRKKNKCRFASLVFLLRLVYYIMLETNEN